MRRGREDAQKEVLSTLAEAILRMGYWLTIVPVGADPSKAWKDSERGGVSSEEVLGRLEDIYIIRETMRKLADSPAKQRLQLRVPGTTVSANYIYSSRAYFEDFFDETKKSGISSERIWYRGIKAAWLTSLGKKPDYRSLEVARPLDRPAKYRQFIWDEDERNESMLKAFLAAARRVTFYANEGNFAALQTFMFDKEGTGEDYFRVAMQETYVLARGEEDLNSQAEPMYQRGDGDGKPDLKVVLYPDRPGMTFFYYVNAPLEGLAFSKDQQDDQEDMARKIFSSRLNIVLAHFFIWLDTGVLEDKTTDPDDDNTSARRTIKFE